ncbi:hypothetical protein EZV62_003500 [Acer yangbiense]|uniref:Disease resistance protein At4g27190-like leucine-rich repeats domain-containing protein n=1 Tax=Acer yangbiense TaxID=1000413 RepID=A0A5C7IHK5_9ROSI|nr:hypothetical protein EZV62_003500 [Acer yangbiense]
MECSQGSSQSFRIRLKQNQGTEIIEAISLDMSSSKARDINLSRRAFAKMENLRLLKFYVSNVWDNRGNKVHVHDEGFESVFNELKYLHWYGFPLKSLQPNFQSKNLVILEMPNSNVEELWSGFPPPVNLKRIDLTGSKQLTSIPNCFGLESLKEFDISDCSKLKRLPELPNNLKTLGIAGCKSLVEIPSSFKYLNKVESLKLNDCESLTSIPDLSGWKSLKYLGAWGCRKLKMLPEVPNNIEIVHLSDTLIKELPPSFEDLDSLKSLSLYDCSMLKSLPSSICKSKSLHDLTLENCSKFDKLPDDIGTLESLRSINARGTAIREIPPSISCLKRLDSLDLSGCKGEDGVGLILPPLSGLDNLRYLSLSDCRIKEIPLSISCLKRLKHFNLSRCKGEDGVGLILPPLSGLDNLWDLNLSDCGIKELPDSLGCLTSMGSLILAKNNFESIPGSIINLSKTWLRIDISNCERIKVLPKLQNWISISAVNCTSLEELPSPSFHSFNPSDAVADFTNCLKLNRNSLNYFLEGTVLQMQRLPSTVKRHREAPHLLPSCNVHVKENRGFIGLIHSECIATNNVDGYATLLGWLVPLVAGIAAIIKSVHQDWSSAAIRSALVTTGTNMAVKPTVALRAMLVGGIAVFAKVAGAMKAAAGVKLRAAVTTMSMAAAIMTQSKDDPKSPSK